MVDPSPQHSSFDRVARMAVSVVTLAVVLALLRYLSDVLIPFAAAAVLAYLLNPLVGVFEERTRRRGLAVALTIGGLGIVGLSVIAILTPLMLAQFGRFQGDLSRLRGDITASLEWAGAAEDESAADETERLSDDRTDSAPRAADGETRRDEGDGAERSAEAKSM
ncbi:MAG: AI-2E family transporter, partial [Phycisphaerae bacterium]